MERSTLRRNYWEFDGDFEHFHNLIGDDYGANPLQQKAAIQRDKNFVADCIKRNLQVKPHQTGLEIGPGCGHLLHRLSYSAKHLYGADISYTYLERAKSACAERANVELQLIENGRLAFLTDAYVDFIYASSVFIHLDIYEIVRYLDEAARVLKPGGAVWFDIVDLDRVDFNSDADFLATMRVKGVDPINKNCIQFNSAAAVVRKANQVGLSLGKKSHYKRCNTQLLFCRF